MTGVQTCALPILSAAAPEPVAPRRDDVTVNTSHDQDDRLNTNHDKDERVFQQPPQESRSESDKIDNVTSTTPGLTSSSAAAVSAAPSVTSNSVTSEQAMSVAAQLQSPSLGLLPNDLVLRPIESQFSNFKKILFSVYSRV